MKLTFSELINFPYIDDPAKISLNPIFTDNKSA